jgi:hypothetical protein
VNLTDFAVSVKGEFVAGNLIATVGGKRQFLHRNGQFTPAGSAAYIAWRDEPHEAIAVPQPEPRRKRYKSGR